ncbi:hypothetical protein PYV02_00245 [Leifsonia sp. H3M29-4]|uniref:hypothetical protein n=1 Tax=Salinibacterium metalliresistens TaxID=3031321 RepID=UPI0023DB7BE6|nr:hypothetical protein [Salinibacterium metalliresistens]MDF1477506.1 hypothetical protein [Salinibacterium metalliresistens]
MKTSLAAIALLAALALSGCATTAPEAAPSPSATDECAGVQVVVDFGVLDAPSVNACVDAGAAADAVADAGITTEGTVDWGDQIVCRVDGRPAADETVEVDGAEPFVEACQSMPAATAYWALWVKLAADAEWEYAQEGLSTLQLDAGQSVGLVYTTGTESTPPSS